MKKALVITKVAALSREIEQFGNDFLEFHLEPGRYEVDDDGSTSARSSGAKKSVVVSPSTNLVSGLTFTTSQSARITELLGAWEEPEFANEKDVSVPKRSLSVRIRG
jgi:hypothetical protein